MKAYRTNDMVWTENDRGLYTLESNVRLMDVVAPVKITFDSSKERPYTIQITLDTITKGSALELVGKINSGGDDRVVHEIIRETERIRTGGGLMPVVLPEGALLEN